MTKYWFATHDPKVLSYDKLGLWISPYFKNHTPPDISIGDKVGIYEPESGKSERQDGAKALVVLATITKLTKPWEEDKDDGFWKIADVTITESDEKGIPLRTVLKILTGEDISLGSKRGISLRNLYAGRVTEISPEQYASFLQYFSTEEPDSEYQEKVTNSEPIEPFSSPQGPEWEKSKGRTILVTKPGIGKYCLRKANFQCEIDNNHPTFTSKATGNNYVEAHHLIPIKYQSSYKNTLDNHGNIVALCPNCHRLLYHANRSAKLNYLSNIFDISKVSALLSISKNNKTLAVNNTGYELGDNCRILRLGILFGSVDIEVSETGSRYIINLLKYWAIVFSCQLCYSIRRLWIGYHILNLG